MEPVRKETSVLALGREGLPRGNHRGEDLVEEDLMGGEGGVVGSPREMGVDSMDRLEREQMQALVEGLAAMDGERSRRDGGVGELF